MVQGIFIFLCFRCNRVQALHRQCVGWRMDLIPTSSLIGWKMDVWKPAVPSLLSHVVFVLEQCWFSDPTFSFLSLGGLMELKKKQANLFFLFFFFFFPSPHIMSSMSQLLEFLHCLWPALCIHTFASIWCPIPIRKALGSLSTVSSLLLFGKKKKFLFSSYLGGCTDRPTLPGDDVIYLLSTHTNSTAVDCGFPVSACDLCCS